MNAMYRTFTTSDIDVLCKLMGQLNYSHSLDSLTENVASLRKSGGEVFVAEVDGNVVGCASAIIDVRLAAGTNGEIVSVVVEESMRGNGIGKGLIEQAESWLNGKVSSIRIRANSQRVGAHKFYSALGYAILKTQSIYVKYS